MYVCVCEKANCWLVNTRLVCRLNTHQTFVVWRSAVGARMRAEEYVRTVVIVVHGRVAVLAAPPRRSAGWTLAGLAASAAAASRLLLLEVLPEHEIHRDRLSFPHGHGHDTLLLPAIVRSCPFVSFLFNTTQLPIPPVASNPTGTCTTYWKSHVRCRTAEFGANEYLLITCMIVIITGVPSVIDAVYVYNYVHFTISACRKPRFFLFFSLYAPPNILEFTWQWNDICHHEILFGFREQVVPVVFRILLFRRARVHAHTTVLDRHRKQIMQKPTKQIKQNAPLTYKKHIFDF